MATSDGLLGFARLSFLSGAGTTNGTATLPGALGDGAVGYIQELLASWFKLDITTLAVMLTIFGTVSGALKDRTYYPSQPMLSKQMLTPNHFSPRSSSQNILVVHQTIHSLHFRCQQRSPESRDSKLGWRQCPHPTRDPHPDRTHRSC